MPDPEYPDPRKEDIVFGDRRISRPDASLPDWEVPDAAYRPVPIVWFVGAMFAEFVAIWLIALIFWSQATWLVAVLATLLTGAVAHWTWRRGMGRAGVGWKVATMLMFAFQLGLLFLALASKV